MKMTSVWCSEDLYGFKTSNEGQINMHTNSGRFMNNLIQKNEFKNLLEIGTWNGLGSTKCILQGLKGLQYDKFVSIETNKDKVNFAIANLKDQLQIGDRIIWGSVISPEEIKNETVVFPELLCNEEFKKWHQIDMYNMNSCPNVFDLLPEKLDFVLFDGGEFTTYFEFLKIKEKCIGYILLDDVNTFKCKKIREILNGDLNWKEVYYTPERNGFACFHLIS
jgi:hypothetical protein